MKIKSLYENERKCALDAWAIKHHLSFSTKPTLRCGNVRGYIWKQHTVSRPNSYTECFFRNKTKKYIQMQAGWIRSIDFVQLMFKNLYNIIEAIVYV